MSITGNLVRYVLFISTSAKYNARCIDLYRPRATGVIVKAFAEGFESQSRNGLATVVIQNTGFVTADFYVSKMFVEKRANNLIPSGFCSILKFIQVPSLSRHLNELV